MNFNSLHFVAFYLLVYLVVVLLGPRTRARNWVLLVASYYFYGCWDWRFLGLILLSTAVDYATGILLDVRTVDPARPPERTLRRKLILCMSLCTSLGILGFFKYYNFFAESAAALLASLGLHPHLSTLRIILPAGVSFYTFQSMSYTIDVYRGKLETQRDPVNFAAFVAFFPQLVAGPITRATYLLPQFSRPTHITWPMIRTGAYLMGWGLFKKVVLADNVAKVADLVFAAPSPTGADVLLGVYAFALQIYCDFSAYSDIARGAARCMGFDLMVNFNLPYIATNPSDFWQRWHISLSTWLRDYLYVPLGGNRKGRLRTYANLMATMLLGGLWHGAAWTFVLWGAYHGLLLCLHRALSPVLARFGHVSGKLEPAWHWLKVVFFFHLVCGSWLLFRARSMEQLGRMSQALVSDLGSGLRVLARPSLETLAVCWLTLFAVEIWQWRTGDEIRVLRFPVPARAFVYAALFFGFLWFGEYGGQPFIYFQF